MTLREGVSQFGVQTVHTREWHVVIQRNAYALDMTYI